VFDIFTKVSQGLYSVAESIAEKEIVKDPINFIKQESSLVENKLEQTFYSMEDIYYEGVYEEEKGDYIHSSREMEF
jgi:hypothetical protein